MVDLAQMRKELAGLRKRVAALEAQVAQREQRIAELEAELRRREKRGYKPQPNRQRPKSQQDRRRKPDRQHGGVFREPPQLDEIPAEQVIAHEVRVEQCPGCGGQHLKETGHFDDHVVVDLPQPRAEYHRYRRHEFECLDCGRKVQGRGELELPGSHVGPRARLFNAYARGHLGISLEKSCDFLQTWFGISLSRAGALGHLAWGGKLFDPVVMRLLDLLRQEPVIHGDETGWRIDGKNVWAWCFSNPRLAVYLIDQSRSSQVLINVLGESLKGVLVCDFYAAYNRLNAAKQRCLTHLLRELHKLRENLPARCVRVHIQPLMTVFQEAIALGKQREQLPPADYSAACDAIYDRFNALLHKPSKNDDVRRIHKRLNKYLEELFTFLQRPGVPADNTPCERDIRSIAAARSDGGVNRAAWSAASFGCIKSVLRTCQKQGRNFLDYGLEVVRSTSAKLDPPLPLADNTS